MKYIKKYINIKNIYLFYFLNYRKKKLISDNMHKWKAELGRGREKRRVEERKSKKNN
jgi:hypothetical protein